MDKSTDESLAGENRIYQKDDEDDFVEDNEDHHNLVKLMEEQGKTEEKEKITQLKKVICNPYKNHSVAKTQLKAILQLASGINKLADVNAKR